MDQERVDSPGRHTDDAGLAPHSLDPLSADEIRRVATAVRDGTDFDADSWRFASIELAEPDKDRPVGSQPARAARVVCWNTADGRAYRALVLLADHRGHDARGHGARGHDARVYDDRLTQWEYLPGREPNITLDEWHECDEMLRRQPALVDALAARGITDMSLVLTDVWAYGAALVPARHSGLRLGWSDVWLRSSPDGNPYAHHITGLHPVVDLNRMTLVELEDSRDAEGGAGRPDVSGEYLPDLVGMPPREISAVQVSQPGGPSFTLDGRLLRWQNWQLRLGFNHREGLVLHEVAYTDGGRVRPIAHRLSFAEMIVPYRDATQDHYRRTAFDIGEWGLGFMTTSLDRGCDCLGEIRYLDAVVHDSHGEPSTIANAICIHEEDDGILWKHVDEVTGPQVRRSQRVVISFHVTVANYEYLIYWRFYQDGNIECEVRATGVMVTSGFAADSQPRTGAVVDNRTYAPYHQHFIVARLDLDIDGRQNTVFACDSRALPAAPGNPQGLALVTDETPLRSQAQGRQDYDWHTQRTWKVASTRTRNGLGGAPAYKLVPGSTFPPMIDPSSPVVRRAGVIQHTLWITPYDPEQRWPCGEFPVQSAADEGLPAWTAQDRPIEDQDLVLWYVFGLHHITRPEDWPVMPTDRVSFWLKPSGFFDRNPALDVPPSHGE
jgi:primary-amine oxidase